MNPKNGKTKTQSGAAEGAAAAVIAGGADSVEKIRDILFGVQMRDYDKKFTRLEERLLKETSDLKDDVKKSLAAFDTFVKRELEGLAGRLRNEHEQRVSALKDAGQELKEVKQLLQERATELQDQIAGSRREMGKQILDQYRTLAEEIRQKADEASQALQREAGELRLEKADRAALAALFTEVALRLKDEFKIPGAEKQKHA